MKIWVSRLSLSMQDEYSAKAEFWCEQLLNDYEYNQQSKEYVESPNTFLSNRISITPKIRYIASGLLVEQGFEQEILEKSEEIKRNMQKVMLEFLERELNITKQVYSCKVKALQMIVNPN